MVNHHDIEQQTQQVRQLLEQGQTEDACQRAIAALGTAGLSLERNPSQLKLKLAAWRTRLQLQRHHPTAFENLTCEPLSEAILTLTATLRDAAEARYPRLAAMLTLQQVSMMTRSGLCRHAPAIYGFYADWLLNQGEVGRAGHFADLCRQFADRWVQAPEAGQAKWLLARSIDPWQGDLSLALDDLESAIDTPAQIVKEKWRAKAPILWGYTAFFCCDSLSQLHERLTGFSPLVDKAGGSFPAQLESLLLMIQIWRGSRLPLSEILVTLEENNQRFLEDQQDESLAMALLLRAFWRTSFSEYQRALDLLTRVGEHLHAIKGTYFEILFYFLDALAHLKVLKSQKQDARKVWARATRCLRRCRSAANQNKRVFSCFQYFLQAEMAAAKGQTDQARANYYTGLKYANEADNRALEAFCFELVAQFHLAQREERLARHYIRDAHYQFRSWDAEKKVRQMEHRYPTFLSRDMTYLNFVTHTTHQGNGPQEEGIELGALIQALQIITSEISFEDFIRKTVKVVTELSGVSRGVLLIPEGDHFVIQGEATMGGREINVLQEHFLPMGRDQAGSPRLRVLAESVVQATAQTKECMHLANPAKDPRFKHDPYFAQTQPLALLCLPLLNQTHLEGLFYLESTIETEPLDHESARALDALTAPIAICLRNSRLYQSLEDKVRVRSQELQKAIANLTATQQRLVEKEKMAALGGLVTGVAHEINTPIGIGVTAISHLKNQTVDITAAYKSDRITVEALKNYLETAKKGSQMVLTNLERANRLIQNFKQVAVDQSSEERRKFNLKQYLEGVLVHLEPTLKDTQVDIFLDCPADIFLDSYPGSLSRILTILIKNAVQHAFPEGRAGRLEIEGLLRDGMAHLIFKDNGVGMSSKVVQHMFDPFFTTKRHQGCIGLGLHTLHNLITQSLRGRILCMSKQGEGTTFRMEFPLNPDKTKT